MDDEEDAVEQGFETHDLGDEDDSVVDTPDGGAIVRLDDEDDARGGNPEFMANLAEDIPSHELRRISAGLIELIDRDREARKERDEQQAEGLQRTGLGKDAPGGAQFAGASRVVHPMLTEASIDFAARAMKELWPANGPVKTKIEGSETAEKRAKAKRKAALMNWQLTVQAKEARAELEQALTQVPMGGAQYMKLGWDVRRNRPTFLFVAIDDMLLPYAASSFYTSERKTHVEYITQTTYEKRVDDGEYIDVDLPSAGSEPEETASGSANDKIEGRNPTSYNEDGLRTVYHVYTTYDLTEYDDFAKRAAEYIISIDRSTGSVLSIYRNWDEDDATEEALEWFIELPFVPWRGAYPIGLPHMIGGLSAAATGALRALLDSAHIQNTAAGLKLKGGSRGGQSLNIQPTEIKEVEGGLNVDDIRKVFMPLPFNGPSPVLFELLGFLVQAGQSVVRTTLEDLADSNANTPVGTTLARLEQAMVVFSAIHGRLHDAMGRMLRVLHRLNALYLDDEELDEEVGEKLATRADFNGPMDIVPVSDPNIYSETQRFAQAEAISQRAQLAPDLYNRRKVEERYLETLKVPNYAELLNPDLQPTERNAVDENVAAALGKPVAAYLEQDHVSHIATHMDFLKSPLLGANPLIAPTALPALLDHVKQHIVLMYAAEVFHTSSNVLGKDLGDAIKDMPRDDATQQALDKMLAQASDKVIAGMAQSQLAALEQELQQLKQVAIQMMPQPQQDPRLAIEGQKVQLAGQKQAQDAQLRGQELSLKAQGQQIDASLRGQELSLTAQGQQLTHQQGASDLQAKIAIAAQSEQHEDDRKAAELQAKMAMNEQDNTTAASISAAEIQAGHKSPLSTGTGINPGD